jgi:hypothetical protein
MLQIGEVQELDAVHATADSNQRTKALFVLLEDFHTTNGYASYFRPSFLATIVEPIVCSAVLASSATGWSHSTFWQFVQI